MRRFDDFDPITQTAFEANTTPWGQVTDISRKLDQVDLDATLIRQGQVKRIVWFGTEPLPAGSRLKTALDAAGINYWVVPLPN